MPQTEFIPVSEPALIGNEKKYVLDCIESNWISSTGKYVNEFEKQFADFCRVKHAISCCNGTAALHIALLAFGVGPGDEVIVPNLTFVATANAVLYCGAKPVFIDVNEKTWTLDVNLIKGLITKKTKAIIPVHLFGHPADLDPILELARDHGFFVLEDAAESHGAEYNNQVVGGIGDIGTFSFYGNKIMTTGEGGMVVTNNDAFAASMRLYKGQGMSPENRYWFPQLGYNYRMTNIQAAIGFAQLENIDVHLKKRKEIAGWYNTYLNSIPDIILQPQMTWATNVYWMNNIILGKSHKIDRDRFMLLLKERNIDSRPFFYPMHTLPYFQQNTEKKFPISEFVGSRGTTLPTYTNLTEDSVKYISEQIFDILK